MSQAPNSCLFCGSNSLRPSFYSPTLFNNKQFEYLQCDTCRLNFNYPLLTQDDYEKLYPLTYHDEFYFKDEKDFSKQISIIKNHAKAPISILDFGCGDGGFLSAMQKEGFICTGVEFSDQLVKKLRSAFPQNKFYSIAEFFETEEKYDCIHLGDVLEHMTQPGETINSLSKKLKNDGFFFIEGPIEHNSSVGYYFRKNYFSLMKKLKPSRVVEGRPYHTFLANKKNQLNFFKKMGFQTKSIEIYETPWPFPDRLANAKTPKLFLEYAVGQISLIISSFIPGWGNRFYYTGIKKSVK